MSARLSNTLTGVSRDQRSRLAVLRAMREHRRQRRTGLADPGRGEAVETEILAILYGDVMARHRAYDTQPSHMWPTVAATVTKGKRLGGRAGGSSS